MFRRRDQNARVTWPHLSFMLGRVAAVDRNATLFASIYGHAFQYYQGGSGHAEGVVFEVKPGEELPQPHPEAYPGMASGR